MPPPKVLFVCGQNAARSQIAAALFRERVEDRATTLSAGLNPAPDVSPVAFQVLEEVGATNVEKPKLLTADMVKSADVIVAVGCGVNHPEFQGKKVQEWKIDDPKGQPIESVRQIRDNIGALVVALAAELELD